MSLNSLIHRQRPLFGSFQYLNGLLLQPLLLFVFRREGDAVRLGVMVLVKVGEGCKAVGSGLFRFTTAVHLGIDGEGRASRMDHLAFEGDDVACKDGELEVDAVEYEQDGVLRVNILRYGEIGALQKPFGASSSKEGLMVVEVGEFDQTL